MSDGSVYDGPERRKHHRLRALIDELRGELRDTRHALEYMRESVAALRVDLEELRQAHNEGRQSEVRPRKHA